MRLQYQNGLVMNVMGEVFFTHLFIRGAKFSASCHELFVVAISNELVCFLFIKLESINDRFCYLVECLGII